MDDLRILGPRRARVIRNSIFEVPITTSSPSSSVEGSLARIRVIR
jgi:hypothetical protein